MTIRYCDCAIAVPRKCGIPARLIVFVMVSSAATAVAQESTDFGAAVTSGKAAVNLRYRYEQVDEDSIAETANASTARLRLNYRTGQWRNWSAFAEFDHLFHIVLTDFNSGAGTSPNKTQYPVVADPKGPDLNQLYLDYAATPDWKVRVGRQRILLDNQRFVGGVGWRQNEQTYDGVSVTTTALRNTHVFYSYINTVRRIFGERVPAGRNETDTHLLNAKVELNDNWSLTPYLYYIDNDDVPEFSTSTIGARIEGGFETDAGKIALVGEFATQADAGNAPVNYDAQYAHIDAGWTMSNGLTLGLGFESLGGGSNPGEAFRTPLATLHAFQGWADKFLTTPAGGIDDIYATGKYGFGKWNLTAVYHDFSAETGSGDYGTELDVSIGRSFMKNYGVLFKAAFFNSDSVAFTDTNKFWIMLTASY